MLSLDQWSFEAQLLFGRAFAEADACYQKASITLCKIKVNRLNRNLFSSCFHVLVFFLLLLLHKIVKESRSSVLNNTIFWDLNKYLCVYYFADRQILHKGAHMYINGFATTILNAKKRFFFFFCV